MNRITPFGYKLIKKGRVNKKGVECYDLAINEEEAAHITEMFIKTVRDGYGSHRLAELMNGKGVRTHNGAKFQCNTVIRILRNRIYTGHYTAGDVLSPKIEELTIIPDELFFEAQKILDQRATANESKREISRNTTGKTLLSGNVFCKACGSRIVSTTYFDRYIKKDGTVKETRLHKYICYHKSRKLNNCDGQGTYIAEKVDKAIIKTVQDMFVRIKEQPEAKAIERKMQTQTQEFKNRKKKLLIEIEKNNKQPPKLQLEIADSLTGDSVYTAEDLALAIKTLKARIAENEQKLSEVEADIDKQIGSTAMIGAMYNNFLSWANEFESATLEQKKMIIGQLIKHAKLERGYQIHIEFNMDYEQFCSQWHGDEYGVYTLTEAN